MELGSNIKQIAEVGVRFKGVPRCPKVDGTASVWLRFGGRAENHLKEARNSSRCVVRPAAVIFGSKARAWFESLVARNAAKPIRDVNGE